MKKITPEAPIYDKEGINYGDIPKITDFSGFTKNPYAAKIRAAGKYYTRAFDYENGTVEITEIEADTHKVLSSKTVRIHEIAETP